METKKDNIYLKILVNILIFVVVLLVIFYLSPILLSLFAPFIIGWFIAWIANPLVRFLEKRVKLLRKYSSAIIIMFIISIILLALYGITKFAVIQFIAFIQELPRLMDLLSDTFFEVTTTLSQSLGGLPTGIQNSAIQLAQNIEHNIIAFISGLQLSEFTLNITSNIGGFLFFVITVFISAYFFIKDREELIDKTKSKIPGSVLEKYNLIRLQFTHAVGGYIKAQFKIMLIVMVILYVGFKILGTQYAFLLAVLTGFIDLLPIFGTGFILWPWALVELILGNYVKALTLVIIYAVAQLLKNIIQPKMVGDTIGMDPLQTMVLMYIGYRLAGFLGLILSIPIGLIIENLYEIGIFDNFILGIKILIKDINNYRKF